jgi:DNA-binding MarR family transcriptional regulator
LTKDLHGNIICIHTIFEVEKIMKINDSLGFLLNTAARKMKNSLDTSLKKYNLTSSQLAVMKLLYEKKLLTQAEIASNLISDRATCGTVIDKLLSKNYVKKKTNISDRRAFDVTLTQKGEKLIEEIALIAQDVNQKAVQGLSPCQLQNLKGALIQIISNFEEED